MAGRLFELHRRVDPTGVSGVGIVADGIEFPDDTVVVHWRGEHPSTVTWPNIGHVEAINGHGGATEIVWGDQR